MVSELARASTASAPIAGCRRLNEAGRQAVEVTAERLAALVDEVLGSARRRGGASEAAGRGSEPQPEVEATCSCGSGIPVTHARHRRAGGSRSSRCRPSSRSSARRAGTPDEALARELLETVKIYNAVPPERRGGLDRGAPRASTRAAGAREPR